MDTYKSIKQAGEGLYKEKGSKFLGFAHAVSSEAEIKAILEQYHKDHHNARHICYAYKLGYDENSPYRMNDDGEPSGTAGKPIYGQILSHELTNTLLVVIRYFGGTKLGVSGLITAYRAAANEAVLAAGIIKKIRTQPLMVSYPFALANPAMRIVKDYSLKVLSQEYNETSCILTVDVRLNDKDAVIAKFKSIHGISIENKQENGM